MDTISLGEVRKNGIWLLTHEEAVPGAFVATGTPGLDCDCILAYILSVSRSYILAHPEYPVSIDQYQHFLSAVMKRRTGFPVAYIVSSKEFFGIDFFVTPDVLIPKPDTELLVETAIAVITASITTMDTAVYHDSIPVDCSETCIPAYSNKRLFQVLDVCTGSGCIAVSLAKALENRSLPLPVHVTGTDISAAALAVAAENARRQRCCISFYQSDLLDIFIHPDSADRNRLFDCVVANPPYVPEHIVRQLLSDGRCEPEQALNGDRDGSADGTGIIRRLIPQVFCLLQQGGCFLLEAGEYNVETVAGYLSSAGFTDIVIHRDLGGLPRLLQAKK